MANSSNHQDGNIGYTKENNGLYILVDGAWIQTCGCNESFEKKKRAVEEELEEDVHSNKNIQAGKDNDGTISRLWSGIMSWLGNEY